MSDPKPKARTQLILTLVAAGVFLVGAVLIPALVNGQARALDPSGLLLPPVVMDQPAPQLGATDLQGRPVLLRDTLGKVVLVNNWATWCPPCKSEMPGLQAYYQAHSAQGFLLVAIEAGEPAATVIPFVRQLDLTFPVWLDQPSLAMEAFKNWDLPSSYLIDRQGRLRMGWQGPVSRASLEKYVTPLLEK